jgi:AMP phosphorylase
MELKIKFMKWSAGRPVAILHKKIAERAGIHVDDRIIIRRNSHSIISVVDTAVGMISESEIGVSTEISSGLGLKEGDIVHVDLSLRPESVSLIAKKMECKRLSEKEVREIISDIVKNALTETEIAYFVSAVNLCGMTTNEIKSMIKSIVETGKTLNLGKRIVVDKHSIGGIPGRTTPIVVAICAAAGLIMPKTSSRAITSPSGTADALEVICRVDFTISEIKKIIKKTGACMVWGGSLGLAPADDKIIQVERLLNLDPESQLLASILAKKIAMGSKYILIEIPFGKNAKVNRKEALHLRGKFELLGKSFNLKLKCLMVETDEPAGNGIGPALEIRDVISVLKRESSCYNIESRSLSLAAEILELAGKSKKNQGMKLATSILNSGKAFDKFLEIINAQDGDINHIPVAKFSHDIFADKNSKIKEIDIKKINQLARVLGCPANKAAGIYLWKHKRDKIHQKEKILTLYSDSEIELREAIKFYKKSKPFILK